MNLEEVSSLAPFLEKAHVERLGNGLTVCLIENRQAPIVTTALWYRAGSRDEADAEAGIAHFLEHMMFKGSPAYGPGEIDRRTQVLGGSNNAFTSRDLTAYYFDFAREHWREALAIEADRMAALNLDPSEVDRERQVILEEISMYESEPWDALDQEVLATLFPGHPYGRPILGYREILESCGARELRSFHRRFYRPDNAVLVVAGDWHGEALTWIEETFGALEGGAVERPRLAPPPPSAGGRVERRHGEVARFQMVLPAPAAEHPDFAALRVLFTLLTGGRSSRLHRSLVDEEQSCLWVAGDLGESPEAGALSFALEVVPGNAPEEVEARLLELLAEAARMPPSPEEMARVRRISRADWVFAHERVHQQALTAGFALGLYDLEFPLRGLADCLSVEADEVQEVASRYLDPDRGGVLGWSLPREEAA